MKKGRWNYKKKVEEMNSAIEGTGEKYDKILAEIDSTSKFKVVSFSMGTRSVISKDDRIAINDQAPPEDLFLFRKLR